MDFEWDEKKAAANLFKHGVSFEQASRVFEDPFAIEFEDRRGYGETRYVIIGAPGAKVLWVAYTERGERIRIISARQAEPNERRRHHDQDF